MASLAFGLAYGKLIEGGERETHHDRHVPRELARELNGDTGTLHLEGSRQAAQPVPADVRATQDDRAGDVPFEDEQHPFRVPRPLALGVVDLAPVVVIVAIKVVDLAPVVVVVTVKVVDLAGLRRQEPTKVADPSL